MNKKSNIRKSILLFGLSLWAIQPSIATAIDSPTNVSNRVDSATKIVWFWDWVNGATQYEITHNGNYIGLTPNPWYAMDNLAAGEHTLSIKSVDQNGRYSSPAISTINNASSRAAASEPEAAPNISPAAGQGTGPIDPASYDYPEVFEKEGYELSFSDEFNNNTLDPGKWNTQLRWDGEFNGERYEYRVINGEDQFYVNIFSDDQEHLTSVVPSFNPFELDGSRLAIRAQRNPLKTTNNNAGYGNLRDMVAQQTFLSGAISTYDKFVQKYGYFEARIKIPSQTGTFPAFWLHHQRRQSENTRRSEIDIMENLGHAPWYIYNTFHYFNNVSSGYSGDPVPVKPQPDGQIYTGIDYSENYHVYAVKWEPDYIAWYIDDQKVSELRNENVNHEELYLILNLAMGGNWTNFPENSGGLGRDYNSFFPNQDDLNTFSNPALEIDYVRVYKPR